MEKWTEKKTQYNCKRFLNYFYIYLQRQEDLRRKDILKLESHLIMEKYNKMI